MIYFSLKMEYFKTLQLCMSKIFLCKFFMFIRFSFRQNLKLLSNTFFFFPIIITLNLLKYAWIWIHFYFEFSGLIFERLSKQLKILSIFILFVNFFWIFFVCLGELKSTFLHEKLINFLFKKKMNWR